MRSLGERGRSIIILRDADSLITLLGERGRSTPRWLVDSLDQRQI